jgi:hypothetical protein
MQDYHQLDIWHRGMDLAVEIYRFTLRLPPDERFNLTAQLVRGRDFFLDRRVSVRR